MFSRTVALLLALGSIVVALDHAGGPNGIASGPIPLVPDNGVVGGNCVVNWTPDPSGSWNQTNIELMTGPDTDRIHITTLTTVDTTGTGATSFNWTCVDVYPASVIYFYQFSHAANPGKLILTPRLAITGTDGKVHPPQFNVQPNGAVIPWGIGDLVNPATRKAAPSYITGEIASPSQAPENITASVAPSSSPTASTTPKSTSGAMKDAGSVAGMCIVGAVAALTIVI